MRSCTWLLYFEKKTQTLRQKSQSTLTDLTFAQLIVLCKDTCVLHIIGESGAYLLNSLAEGCVLVFSADNRNMDMRNRSGLLPSHLYFFLQKFFLFSLCLFDRCDRYCLSIIGILSICIYYMLSIFGPLNLLGRYIIFSFTNRYGPKNEAENIRFNKKTLIPFDNKIFCTQN